MSHKVNGQHTKMMQHLNNGKNLDIKGYSHVVSVRQDKKDSWLAKGYEVIEESADAVLVGKKKEVKQEVKKESAA